MRRVESGHRNLLFGMPVAISSFGLAVMILFFLAAASPAQTQDIDDPAPPPLRLVSKGEKSQLDSQNDSKRRVELALEFMDSRLKKAEELRAAENFDAMFVELGGFQGLLDNTLTFLSNENRQRGKAFNYYKKYEMGLRGFTPRIELLRRDLPIRYEQYPVRLLKYLRDARSKVIEPFFGDTVIPNSPE